MSETPSNTRHLTEAEWAEAKGLYETGKMTKSSLAKKYNVSRPTMTNGLNARGAVYGSRSSEVEKATIENAKSDAAKLSDEIATMRQDRLKNIDLADKLQRKLIAEALRDSRPLSSMADEFRTLNMVLKNNKIIREEYWAVYDLDRDPDAGDEIPEFIVSEYTDDEIDALNRERFGEEVEPEIGRIVGGEGASSDGLDELLDGVA